MSTVGIPMKVLCVDPHRDCRESLSDLVDTWGYTAASACNGATALQSVQALRPDVIITEINLPDMDGAQLLARLGPVESRPSCVALTTNGSAEARERALEAGFAHYLLKATDPCQFRMLLADLARGD